MVQSKMVLEVGSSSKSRSNMECGAKGEGEYCWCKWEDNKSVLIVDDDPIVRRIHDVLVKKFGLKTQVVEDGKQAVDLLRLGLSFDLILIDNNMPVMTGVQATKELREMGVGCMIVGVTTKATDAEMTEFKEAGLDYCFAKPLTIDIITYIISKLMNKIN